MARFTCLKKDTDQKEEADAAWAKLSGASHAVESPASER